MFLKWFDATEAKRFGESLGSFYSKRIAPDATLADKSVREKVDKTLGQMSLQIVQFRQKNVLNMYTKAQLGNSFKWTLHEAGFGPDYVDELTKWLVIQLS